MFDSERLRFRSIFLDCGAHSVRTGRWDRIPIEEYAAFCAAHHDCFNTIAAPDVIGDHPATLANTFKFVNLVKGKVPLEKLLPTYHLQTRDPGALKEMVQESKQMGLTRFALGGIADKRWSTSQRIVALDHAVRLIPRHHFKVHIFGLFANEIVREILPDSIDSSAVMQRAFFLRLFRCSPTGVVSWPDMKDFAQDKPKCLKYLVKLCLEHRQALDTMGLEHIGEGELTDIFSRMSIIYFFIFQNILAVHTYTAHVRRTYPNMKDFVYFVTIPHFEIGGKPHFKLMQHGLEHIGLVPYNEFHDRGNVPFILDK